MNYPIHLQTKAGLDEWSAVQSKYQFAKENNLKEWFKQYCMAESMKKEIEVIHFLEKTEFQIDIDAAIMLQWKEMADQQSVYSYMARSI